MVMPRREISRTLKHADYGRDVDLISGWPVVGSGFLLQFLQQPPLSHGRRLAVTAFPSADRTKADAELSRQSLLRPSKALAQRFYVRGHG